MNLIALRCSGPIGLCVAVRRRQRGQITTGSFGRELVGLKHERRAQLAMRAFTPIRCWRPTCANSRSGATGRHVLIAVARYLAAHSPTERAVFAVARMRRDELSRLGPRLAPGTPGKRHRISRPLIILRAWHRRLSACKSPTWGRASAHDS